jgi:hypothetical protein
MDNKEVFDALKIAIEEWRAWMDDAIEGDFSVPNADDERAYARCLEVLNNQPTVSPVLSRERVLELAEELCDNQSFTTDICPDPACRDHHEVIELRDVRLFLASLATPSPTPECPTNCCAADGRPWAGRIVSLGEEDDDEGGWVESSQILSCCPDCGARLSPQPESEG